MGMNIPEGSLVAGPGSLKKPLSLAKREGLKGWALKYLAVKDAHLAKFVLVERASNLIWPSFRAVSFPYRKPDTNPPPTHLAAGEDAHFLRIPHNRTNTNGYRLRMLSFHPS